MIWCQNRREFDGTRVGACRQAALGSQHEGHDLEAQVEAYKKRYFSCFEVVIAGTLYGSCDNRSYPIWNAIIPASQASHRSVRQRVPLKKKMN